MWWNEACTAVSSMPPCPPLRMPLSCRVPLAPHLFLLRQVAELQQQLAAVKRVRDEARAAADRVEAELQEEKARFRRWGRQGRQERRESVSVICRVRLGEVCLWFLW